jgi:O-antigen/teichoic acid export membrane protein
VNAGPSSRAKVVWALLDQALVSGCTFLVTLIVARTVSVADFSAYGLSVTVCLFISAMHRSYLTQPMSILGVTEGDAELGRRFKAVWLLHLSAWPIVLAVLVLVGWRYFPHIGFSVSAFVFVSAYLMQELVRRMFFTTGRHIEVALMDTLAYGGQVVAVIVSGFVFHAGVTAALLAGAATFILGALWGWTRLEPAHRDAPWPTRQDIVVFAKAHWVSSRWICFSQVFMFGSVMIVPFQIAEFGSVIWLAQYNAMTSILNVLNILRQAMGNYLPIVVARIYHDRGIVAFDKAMNRMSLAVLGASALVVMALLVAGPWIVHVLYGDRYAQAADVLPIGAIGPLVAMVSFVTHAGGLALGRTEHIFFSYVAGTLSAVAVAPWLIRHHGLLGAAWVANIGFAVPAIWHWWVFKQDCRRLLAKESST